MFELAQRRRRWWDNKSFDFGESWGKSISGVKLDVGDVGILRSLFRVSDVPMNAKTKFTQFIK